MDPASSENAPSRFEGLASLFFPVLLARALFAAGDVYAIDDRWHSRVSRLRSVALACVLVGTILRFDPSFVWRYPGQAVNSASNTTLVAMVVIAATLLVTATLVRPPWRGAALKAMARPTVRMAGLLLFAFGGQALGWWTLGAEPPPTQSGATGDVSLTSFVWSLVLLVLFALLLVFMAGALYYLGRDLFAVADAHPRLLPVVSIALAAVMAGLDVAAAVGHRAPFLLEVESARIPQDLASSVAWIAVVSAIALSVWEFRLVGAQGYRLRDGAWR